MKSKQCLSMTPQLFLPLLLSALFSLLLFLPAHADTIRTFRTANGGTDRQIVQLRSQINMLIAKGTYSLALPKVNRYVYLVQRKYGKRHLRFAKALLLKARIYRLLNRRAEAKSLVARATLVFHAYKKQKATRRKQQELRQRLAEMRRRQHRHQAGRASAPSGMTGRPKSAMRGGTGGAVRKKQSGTRSMGSGTAASSSGTGSAPLKPVIKPTASPSSHATRGFSSGHKPETAAPTARKDQLEEVDKPKNHTIVKVYYATDRQRQNTTRLAGFFGGEPSYPKQISYGICEVSIPKTHKAGELEAPSIWRFEWSENPDKHVVLLKIHPQEKKAYFANLKEVIQKAKGRNAFIFVHGYNVTFKDAARRTAQISYDLKFSGAPVFYSWPSKGELKAYTSDEENILWAQENIKTFLKDFVEKTDAENIYLIAHSMGSRALTGAVAALADEDPRFKNRFREIILAAPDINARVFRDQIAPKMIKASNNITLYVSDKDKALLASREFHNNARAGEAGEHIVIVPGIDTIDASNISGQSMLGLGHSYWAEAKSMIADILSIFKGQPAASRKTLRPVKTARGTYWAFASP